jgi:hypothetical protein
MGRVPHLRDARENHGSGSGAVGTMVGWFRAIDRRQLRAAELDEDTNPSDLTRNSVRIQQHPLPAGDLDLNP